MANRIVWSRRAVSDLEALRTYISRDSDRMAQRAVKKIYAATRPLKRFSQFGRVVPELGDESLREVFWKSYRIVYWIDGDTITILTVFHGAREFQLEEGDQEA